MSRINWNERSMCCAFFFTRRKSDIENYCPIKIRSKLVEVIYKT